MIKRLSILIVALIGVVCGSAFASEVVDVSLEYQNGFTVAKIKIDGQIRFSHQTEVAKDGKPYRVIVDVLSATHKLPGRKFMELPNCPVQGIRTSQYAVNPEAIVRIVYDMDAERIYRIDTENDYIYIFFSDTNTKPFIAWNAVGENGTVKAETPAKVVTAPVKPAAETKTKSVPELNESINKDRMASLEEADKKPAKQVSKPVVTPPKQTPKTYGPDVTVAAIDEDQQDTPVQPKKKEEPKKVVKQQTAVSQKAVTKPSAKPSSSTSTSTATVKPKPVAKPAPGASKPALANTNSSAVSKAPAKKESAKQEKPQQSQAKKSTQPESKPTTVAKKNAKQESKSAQAAAKPAESNKSTSRFRRSSTSAKIQGTLVAEFPKRLVIKYKGNRTRDPFETLINESKTYNDPVERRVPNVEGLKLVGIIESPDQDNRALFEDSEGYGYILKTGDKVRKGYVLRVDRSKVYFQIFEYGWSRTVALNLES